VTPPFCCLQRGEWLCEKQLGPRRGSLCLSPHFVSAWGNGDNGAVLQSEVSQASENSGNRFVLLNRFAVKAYIHMETLNDFTMYTNN